MSKVVIITTGGTIAMQHDSVTGAAVPAVSGADLVRAIPGLGRSEPCSRICCRVASASVSLLW